MSMKDDKKCVTFWIEKELLKKYDNQYHAKSFFIRECIKKAIEDKDFYISIITGVGGKK